MPERDEQPVGHAGNADGSVRVTAAASGAVLGLELSPLAMRRTHTELQAEILATIRRATEHAAAGRDEDAEVASGSPPALPAPPAPPARTRRTPPPRPTPTRNRYRHTGGGAHG
ncbi:hypothetical protein SAMN05421810_107207 [Amycolatopsis arida]|uniref:YbaB/EbfC DNA-binding family protein n=1 Tax=Amycolatopsis arida TaxID=587909 RepID=A0A1I5YJF9_9PSEU|nr:YbaB/EbfC family nucleoid-associated protein [Amycolatopsis arida]TDX90560.1 hypothetical protein CLV69_107207 [Amycolatopsis arida]SFQ44322.1 hypothetical protein SAMN05421810_107207 [Amycolatopsis arida]